MQAYVFGAKSQAAQLAGALGKEKLSNDLQAQAEKLRQCFEDVFWCDDLSLYALALDGDKRPCRVRASNAGHCLFTGMASPERAALVVRSLLDEDLFSGWGVRTLSTREVRYNAMSYHNGSIWPYDNAIIASGFARYGKKEGAVKILTGMLDASLFLDLHRLPELFCGFDRRPGEGPRSIPWPARHNPGQRHPCFYCSRLASVFRFKMIRPASFFVELTCPNLYRQYRSSISTLVMELSTLCWSVRHTVWA